jgi:predicted DNA repair protein MutK
MFMVGGGILTHGVPAVHHWIEGVSQSIGGISWLMPTLLNAIAGIIAGALVLALVSVVSKGWRAVRG